MRYLAMIAFVAACGVEEQGDYEVDDNDEVEVDVAPYGYSGWRRVYSTSTSYVEIRFCKTSTRVNWEFRHNPYAYATTWGSAMSSLTSSIGASGSKYRTHNGSAWMAWNFAVSTTQGPLTVTGTMEYLSNIPAC